MTSILAIPPIPATTTATRQRRFGGAAADAMLRATGGAGLAAILVLLLIPGSAVMIPLVVATLVFRGPITGIVPLGLEPVLMFYGQLYPAWLVMLVAAGASAYAEIFSQHVVRGMVSLPLLTGVRNRLLTCRVMHLFQRRPAIAVAITALSPVPDSITRVLAATARYPVGRYVVADTIGRLPKLFLPAALGSALHLPTPWLAGTVAGSCGFGAAVLLLRRIRARTAGNLAPTSFNRSAE